MTLAMNTDVSAGLTASVGSGVSAPLPFRLAVKLIAGEITAGALPINPATVATRW
jgi:hypothetical protein